MKITYEQLQKLQACEGQLKLFRTLFGDEVEVTRELIIEHAEKFDWDWAAESLLSREKYEDYREKRKLIYEDYREKIKQIDEDHRRQCAPIFADCLLEENV